MMSEVEYENLEIVWQVVEKRKYFRSAKSIFWAKALGKAGEYNAGESPVFLASDRDGTPPNTIYEGKNTWLESQRALEVLTAALAADGWELVGTQGNWHQRRFRRPIGEVKSQQASTAEVISQLERLNDLHNSGGLSDEEFQQMKKNLLGM